MKSLQTWIMLALSIFFLGASIGKDCRVKPSSSSSKIDAVKKDAKEKVSFSELEQTGSSDRYSEARARMVLKTIVGRGVQDPAVLKAMYKAPRHEFIPENMRDLAYQDNPVPIGMEQTISQPYIVAFMTEQLKIKPGDKVLEIGTGSGYQAAVLSELTEQVFTIEILCELGDRAIKTLRSLGYDQVEYKCADGYQGWPEHAPFDAIIVTAAPDHIPEPLIEQLTEGGRMIIPVGRFSQELILITKTEKGLEKKSVLPVRFVPMTGEAEKK